MKDKKEVIKELIKIIKENQLNAFICIENPRDLTCCYHYSIDSSPLLLLRSTQVLDKKIDELNERKRKQDLN